MHSASDPASRRNALVALGKVRRGVVVTDVGKTVYRFAGEIFALGRGLQDTVRGWLTPPMPASVRAKA